jgi:uncharacterized RDD family membrane protein YckC
MRGIGSYIDEVLDNLPPGFPGRDRIAADLRAHIEESVAAGEEPESVMARMGTPAEVAEELSRGHELHYAPWLRRIGAAAVDVALLMTVMGLIVLVGMLFIERINPWVMPACIMGVSVIPLAYFWVAEAMTRQTIGKWLFGLVVANEKGGAVSMQQALVRRLSIVFSGALALDALIMLFTRKRQRGLDMVAHTVVLRGPDDVPPAWSWIGLLATILGTMVIFWSLFTALA